MVNRRDFTAIEMFGRPRADDEAPCSALCFLISGFVLLLASTVLVGWVIESSSIVQIRPDFVPMRPNTALCFLLQAFSLALLHLRRYRISALLASVSLGIAVLTLLQYILGNNFGIDTFLIEPFVAVKTSHLGRMSPNSAIGFIVFSVALIFATLRFKNHSTYAFLFVLAVLIVKTLPMSCFQVAVSYQLPRPKNTMVMCCWLRMA